MLKPEMDVGLVLSVTQTLFSALHSSEVKEICSLFGYQSQLDELQHFVSTARAMLRDAESKQGLSCAGQLWIQDIKSVVYDADDLLDEFFTLAKQKKHLKEGKISEKLHHFLSCRNPVTVACKISREVKKIRKKLDGITNNHRQIGNVADYRSFRKREETCSYVYEKNIIGRKDDVEKIVSLLLNPNNKQDVSFLTIVGIGGLGKTALAQLVFNDARITSAFPLRLWVCVSDHEQGQWDMKEILHKILASATGQKPEFETSTMEWLQVQLREKIMRRKYLLVLDDVWTENHNHWLQLVKFLLGCQCGCWILVTTRSKETARIVGGDQLYELQGLSEENSWLLFEKTAFVLGQSKPYDDLAKIGQEIIKECASNPLAIRVAGSLLYGQDKSIWLLFQEIGLCNFKERENDIMPILMFSYHQLEFPLKSCFSYCALFPKDFEVKKDLLIDLWMAQGFVVPFDEGQRVEDAAEEYISILLQRCFFHNVEHDEYGEIFSFKLHDLLHDLAKKVAGEEFYVTNSVTHAKDEKIRHVAFMRSKSAQYSFTESHIRSLLYHGFIGGKMQWFSLKALFAKWKCLRALDLSFLGIKTLPNSIGELLHLRYLDLSHNDDLTVLPKSMVNLYNLQTLSLSWCQGLKELPKDLRRLVNLRVLNTANTGISYMPRGLGDLSCLHTLTMFSVKDTSLSRKQWFDQLEELEHLKNLKGRLHVSIDFPENARKVQAGGRKKGAYLRTKKHLNDIDIVLKGKGNDEEVTRLMEELQPHSNVKGLLIIGDGVKMPSWGRENNLVTSLCNLIRLELSHIDIDHLTCLGFLPYLKKLSLDRLQMLDCILEDKAAFAARSEPMSSEFAKKISLFPSLEELNLSELPNLTRWSWKLGVGGNDELLVDTSSSNMTPFLLPQLKKVSILNCPKLRANLLCPILEEIYFEKFNNHLQIITPSMEFGVEIMKSTSSSISSSSSSSTVTTTTATTTTLSCSSSTGTATNLRRVEIDNVAWLNLLPLEAFQRLEYLSIRYDKEIVRLGELGDVFQSCSSTLRFLKLEKCCNLRSVLCEGLEHLTALKDLCIRECHKLSLMEGIEAGDCLAGSCYTVQTLLLEDLPQLTELPNWIQYFTTLQSLCIRACRELKSLPNWMPRLTSLRKLVLWDCSECLMQRCQTSGEDWPYIQHIPYRIL